MNRKTTAVVFLFALMASSVLSVAQEASWKRIDEEKGWYFEYKILKSPDGGSWVIQYRTQDNPTVRTVGIPISQDVETYVKKLESSVYSKATNAPIVAKPRTPQERSEPKEATQGNQPELKGTPVYNYTITDSGEGWKVDIYAGSGAGTYYTPEYYPNKDKDGNPLYRYQVENFLEQKKKDYMKRYGVNYTPTIKTPNFTFDWDVKDAGDKWILEYTYGSKETVMERGQQEYDKTTYPKETVENAGEKAKADYLKSAGIEYEPKYKKVPQKVVVQPSKEIKSPDLPDRLRDVTEGGKGQVPVIGGQTETVRYYYEYEITDGGDDWVVYVVYGSSAYGSEMKSWNYSKSTNTYAYLHNAYEDTKANWLSKYGITYEPQYVEDVVVPPEGIVPPVVESPAPVPEMGERKFEIPKYLYEVLAIGLIIAIVGLLLSIFLGNKKGGKKR